MKVRMKQYPMARSDYYPDEYKEVELSVRDGICSLHSYLVERVEEIETFTVPITKEDRDNILSPLEPENILIEWDPGTREAMASFIRLVKGKKDTFFLSKIGYLRVYGFHFFHKKEMDLFVKYIPTFFEYIMLNEAGSLLGKALRETEASNEEGIND